MVNSFIYKNKYNDNLTRSHTFYIPVMGTSFTVDTPLKVAKYGISSAISLVDDVLIEQMRKFICTQKNYPYKPIPSEDINARAKRITSYLNLVHRLVMKQTKELQNTPFIEGTEITRYYELLPEVSTLKKLYNKMLATKDSVKKTALQTKLRNLATPGNIDVNIMTKLDGNNSTTSSSQPSYATAALIGYAKSTLDSAIIFSAGFNSNIYGKIATFKDFLPDKNGYLKKKIILKVSDYRSALIQGKYLATRGLWISEYRIESALNCGGHAFVNDGNLMGPILEEFKQKKTELLETLNNLYNKALIKKNILPLPKHPPVRFTAQGGIGNYQEHQFLLQHYNLDAIGWGTPFLLVPEIVNIDDEHLQKLSKATDKDITLSNSSPLNIPFWNLIDSASEIARLKKIAAGYPGSHCPKKYAKFNTEFTDKPICIASHTYQKKKLESIKKTGYTKAQINKLTEKILAKACICHDLAGSATKKYKIDIKANTAVCPGPNIANFSKIASLEEMVNHIYGRVPLPINPDRQNMFIAELLLNLNFLKNEIHDSLLGLATRSQDKLQLIKENLLNGIDYYHNLAKELLDKQQGSFIKSLNYYATILTLY